MATHQHHTGTIWSNVPDGGVHRRHGPGESFAVIDPPLHKGQSVIVLCYSRGQSERFTNPFKTNTSDAWDFVVTSDGDPGGYVADVFVDTDEDITHRLGPQGACDLLRQRLANPNTPDPNPPGPIG